MPSNKHILMQVIITALSAKKTMTEITVIDATGEFSNESPKVKQINLHTITKCNEAKTNYNTPQNKSIQILEKVITPTITIQICKLKITLRNYYCGNDGIFRLVKKYWIHSE